MRASSKVTAGNRLHPLKSTVGRAGMIDIPSVIPQPLPIPQVGTQSRKQQSSCLVSCLRGKETKAGLGKRLPPVRGQLDMVEFQLKFFV